MGSQSVKRALVHCVDAEKDSWMAATKAGGSRIWRVLVYLAVSYRIFCMDDAYQYLGASS